MTVSHETERLILAAVRDARIHVVGYDLVKNEPEAAALLAVLKAYGQSPAGFVYASPSRARTSLRPPDIVLCHPDVGLLVIEVKGFAIEQIEGLEAGSGKSIVLARLVARYLHRELNALLGELWPERRISVVVTCFNHALVDFLKQKIRVAFREQTLTEDIPSEVLTVTHLNHLMYQLKTKFQWPIDYITVESEKEPVARAVRYRQQIREFAAKSPELYRDLCFDALFVDEGQDFAPEEWLLFQELIRPHSKTGEKTLVIFYDDAQNLYGRSRPVWKDLGINVTGERSRVMRECFRNTRPIVELAFNVLLGSQAPPDVRVQTRGYADINFLKERGLVEEVGDYIRVGFAEREYQAPQVLEFPSQQAEIAGVGDEIVRLIREQDVRPEDILVVFFGQSVFDVDALQRRIAGALPDLGFVRPFGKSEDKDRFIFQRGRLTLSTVHGAKGYDAPIVFLVGADRFPVDTSGRAAFYVGATRAKLLLTVSGCRREGGLLAEAEALRGMM